MISFNHVYRGNQLFGVSYRSFSLNVFKSIRALSRSPNPKVSKEIYEYLKNIGAEYLFKEIPINFLENRTASRFILINPYIAKKVSSVLKVCLKGSYVLESDPGFGYLSKELIHTVSHLRLYEADDLLRSYLRDLSDRYRGKIEIFESSLQSIYKLQRKEDADNGNCMAYLFDSIPTDINVNVIVIVPYPVLVWSWIRQILNNQYFSKFSQLDMYVFMLPSVYTRLIASPQNDYHPRYQKFSVFSQILFDIKLLMNDIPRKDFLPWPRRPVRKKMYGDMERYENDHEVFYLVQMSLKPESFNCFRNENIYQCFHSFLGRNMIGKKRIVPYFESIIPGSGPRVIMLGHNIYSTFNELNPNEIFSLFLQLTKWPEFQSTGLYSYWKNSASFDDYENCETGNLQNSRDEDEHDEDDNEDDAFLPGNNVE